MHGVVAAPSISSSILGKHRCHFATTTTIFPDRTHLAQLLQGSVPIPHLLQIHARVFRLNAHNDHLIAARLIGRHPARLAFHILTHLRSPNIFPFNAAIRVLSDSPGLVTSAFSVFRLLKHRSILPNGFTLSFLLKACFRCGDARLARQVHTHVVKSSFGSDESVVGGLILVYGKGVGDVVSARKVFDGMADKWNVGWWTCLIAGYAHLDLAEEALVLFLRMLSQNVCPTDDTMVSVLSSCSNLNETQKWVCRFSDFRVESSDAFRDSVDTVLIYLYGKRGEVERSRRLFDELSARRSGRMSVVTWNAMLSGCAQNGHPVEALDIFQKMLAASDPKPNHVTMVNMLSACTQAGNLDLGKWAHNYIKFLGREDVLESNTILATAFIDMYSKCGSLEGAEGVFRRIIKKDVVVFNAMMMGLAVNGKGVEAIQLFHRMKQVNLHPNGGTFLGLLSACAHAGLIREGRVVFADMEKFYSIKPKLEHYACYVDLLARCGRIEEALEIVLKMPVRPNAQVWGALLAACTIHHNTQAARFVTERLVDVDPQNSAGYVMLSNAYATNLRWGEIAELRGRMKEKGVKKLAGCSWISVDGVIHEFFVGCRSHPQIDLINLTLDMLYRKMISKVHS